MDHYSTLNINQKITCKGIMLNSKPLFSHRSDVHKMFYCLSLLGIFGDWRKAINLLIDKITEP